MKALFLWILVGWILSIWVGPLSILLFQRTVQKGWIFGIISGAGIALADIFYAGISRAGLIFLKNFISQHQGSFQIGFGILLLVVGSYVFFSHNSREKNFHVEKNYFQNFITAFLLNMANILNIFLYGIVFAKFLPLELTRLSEEIFLVIGIGLGALIWRSGLTYIFSHFRVKFEKIFILNRILGSIIFFFGIASFVELRLF
jgi:threonine/homoserine/homoserine lactone efflux protein